MKQLVTAGSLPWRLMGARRQATACLAGLALAGLALPGFASELAGEEAGAPQVIEREGVRIAFTTHPLGAHDENVEALREADHVEVRFRITDPASGQPVTGLYPAAWMDLAASSAVMAGGAALSCDQKIQRYAQGNLNFRPLIDLNSYHVLTLNRDATISVLDPIVNVAGLTSTYAMLPLRSPGADWALSPTGRRLFVSMPGEGEIGVFDTDSFELVGNYPVGHQPVRLALSADGQRLWIGDDAPAADQGGVLILDTASLEVIAAIATGAGHHDIALTADGRLAFVTNSEADTLSVIDAETFEVLGELDTGDEPVSVAYSRHAEAAFVAARDGTVTVVDGITGEVRTRRELEPGLRMVRFSPDGRWAFLVNTDTDSVEVIDPATHETRHRLAVEPGPDQVSFTQAYAYVRSLGSPKISMIPLEGLGRQAAPPVMSFASGSSEPARASRVGLDNAVSQTNIDHAVLVANPTADSITFYMEGMAAPMGTFRNFGHFATSVKIVDRSVSEREPGLYTTQLRLPAAGTYDLALLLDSPRMTHCFALEAEENPTLANPAHYAVSFDERPASITAGNSAQLRFQVSREERRTSTAIDDQPVYLSYFLSPGLHRTRVPARVLGDGRYEVDLAFERAGAYYLFVEVPALGIGAGDIRPTVILSRPQDAVRERVSSPANAQTDVDRG
ncbi:YncE family protein [Halomonas urumqiensis]|uniref:Cytochrome D1 n=1 Tax=Halomonas urumqiensis TaxID=1684789 RepID=A0A2N7UP95_9GAMM|nr:YncE family protein [Halomonas urumqiensis]PMR82246.1 cytochrome D1 [Halomonas urumqiensis]PTB02976.1 YncE family protein [Halomonas urumqiensis]GHE20907.1 hypothetical protein GCM10017767_14280 [Halomonas urumqiensis]